MPRQAIAVAVLLVASGCLSSTPKLEPDPGPRALLDDRGEVRPATRDVWGSTWSLEAGRLTVLGYLGDAAKPDAVQDYRGGWDLMHCAPTPCISRGAPVVATFGYFTGFGADGPETFYFSGNVTTADDEHDGAFRVADSGTHENTVRFVLDLPAGTVVTDNDTVRWYFGTLKLTGNLSQAATCYYDVVSDWPDWDIPQC